MAQHLDLEEQEQLDQIKHFWNRYGNLITTIVTVVLLAYAGWNGYQYWQVRQAQQAAVLFEELDRAVLAKDKPKIERVWQDLRAGHAGTAQAAQGALLAAQGLADTSQPDAARAALEWLVAGGKDAGLQAVARLRLAGLLAAQNQVDAGLGVLAAEVPAPFVPLLNDRKGDLLLIKGDKAGARDAYRKAFDALEARHELRRLVAVKLNALGVDTPEPAAGTPQS